MDWRGLLVRAGHPGVVWGCGVLAVAGVVAWTRTPPAVPMVKRVPGADRPAATESAVATGNVFDAGTLTVGSGRPAAIAGAWVSFRGARRDGFSQETASLARSWPQGQPRELWRIEVGEGFAGPVVADGRVYLMDYDREAGRDALRCLSLQDGAEIWRYSYPLALKRNHGLTRTVPSVAAGRVVAMGPKCHVICVEAESGKFAWGLDLVRDFGAVVPPWYTGQCPWTDGETVVLAPGGPEALLMGVDLKSGSVRWRTPNPDDWKMTHSSVVPLDLGGRRYFLYCASGGVVAVDAADGAIRWQTGTWKINIATVPSPVILDDGEVFFTGGYNAGSMLIRFAVEDGVLTGREVWRVKASVFGATQHSPLWHGGRLYGIRADGQFVCLSREGEVVWASGPEAKFGLGPLLGVNGWIFAMNDSGRLTLLEANPDAYRVLAEAQVLDGHESWGPMALAGGRLLARDLTRMLCLEVGDGVGGGVTARIP